MTWRDLAAISTGNLRRMKLRTILTSAGVLIAIAAFVSMVSFGAGNQENITRQYDQLGLFTTMQVFPKPAANGADTSSQPKLDATAIEKLSAIPGVNLVYPYDATPVTVRLGDTVLESRAQALPSTALRTKLFSRIRTGSLFGSDTSREAVVSDDLLRKAGIAVPESAIGRPMTLSVHVSTIDSGLAHIWADRGETVLDRIKKIRMDSLRYAPYRDRIIRGEMNATVRRFLNGFLSAREVISETLTVCGVREIGQMGRLRIEPIMISVEAVRRLRAGGLSGNLTDVLAAVSTGELFIGREDATGKEFSQVTLNLDPNVLYKSVRDSVEALGFRTFSFAAQFEEIQKFFFYFNLALGVVGLIALLTASLGIVNTMVMSILERKREIGILKSLGADEVEIRALFLVESGVIGALGTTAGILFGWLITRIVSFVGQAYMRREGIPVMDLFALPAWLILTALAVGIGVSVLAGFYPAARAARVDPVEALRNE